MLFAVCAHTCQGDNAIRNPDFSVTAPGESEAPAHWDLPRGHEWKRLANDGPDGRPCLSYEAGAVVADPVTQQGDFCRPNAQHELRAMLRSDGHLRPLLRVVDGASQKELAAVAGLATADWHAVTKTFRTVSADIVVEIYADVAHARGEKSAAGKVWVAQVQVTGADREASAIEMPDVGENLALGKPYTMTPPNYGLCTDPDDKTQLTDGAYTEGHFWTRKTTVGWSGTGLTYINLDLGRDQPIKGVSLNTAAGVAEVRWPRVILVFVSADGESWQEVGELVSLSTHHAPLPDYGDYHVRKLWTDQLRTHGRYVQFCCDPGEQYLFVDEIEVFRGDGAWLNTPYAGEPVADLKEHMSQRVINGLIRKQFIRDLQAVSDDIAELPEAGRAGYARRADALADAIQNTPPVPMEGFRAVLPMTDLERDIFKLQAAVWRAQGKPELRLWKKHRWDPLAPSEEPEGDAEPPVLDVHMMQNEYRAEVLNLTNAADKDKRVVVRIAGLSGGSNRECFKVHEVLTVGTRRFVAVSAALPEAQRVANGWVVSVPAGMTRQVWLSIHTGEAGTGAFTGVVQILDGQKVHQVPLKFTVYPLGFPDEPSLLVGGWSYTNSESVYGVTPQNRMALIAHLQEHFVNAPWASSSALGDGEYDHAGQMMKEPATSNFDNWVALWPKAKMYLVFKAVGDSFAGSKMGTDLFGTKVGNWARFWAGHLRESGLDPSQLGILILDEPNRKEQYDIITAWANAIEAAAPEIVTWEDPQPHEEQHCLGMFASVDVLCPYRHPFMARPDWYRDLFLDQQRQGRELWFYSADGPARSFDPFSYYLLQEWHCFKIGAKGSCFWAFGDNGRVSCWNEYPAAGKGPYCPTYIDEHSVTAAKYMEAIREGVEDYEYLTMLQSRVNELVGAGVPAGRLKAATDLLATACDRVMAMEEGANYRWDEKKDRSIADTVRIEILEVLTELATL